MRVSRIIQSTGVMMAEFPEQQRQVIDELMEEEEAKELASRLRDANWTDSNIIRFIVAQSMLGDTKVRIRHLVGTSYSYLPFLCRKTLPKEPCISGRRWKRALATQSRSAFPQVQSPVPVPLVLCSPTHPNCSRSHAVHLPDSCYSGHYACSQLVGCHLGLHSRPTDSCTHRCVSHVQSSDQPSHPLYLLQESLVSAPGSTLAEYASRTTTLPSLHRQHSARVPLQ